MEILLILYTTYLLICLIRCLCRSLPMVQKCIHYVNVQVVIREYMPVCTVVVQCYFLSLWSLARVKYPERFNGRNRLTPYQVGAYCPVHRLGPAPHPERLTADSSVYAVTDRSLETSMSVGEHPFATYRLQDISATQSFKPYKMGKPRVTVPRPPAYSLFF